MEASALCTEKREKGGKLGECEAALKRRTDRPFTANKAMKTWREITAM